MIAMELQKAQSGIRGLDDVTDGGLPRGRATLICGGPGSGKTLLATTFVAKGASEFDEPGVLMTFEEHGDEIAAEVASLGIDLDALVRQKKLIIDCVRIERAEIEETGEYDLEGLFVRLGHAIDSIGAKRIALDTIESLFSGLSNESILRAEIRRLFRWLKDKGVTAVVTGERGQAGQLTRQGLEEYISDAVILLDHRVQDQISTRRLRVVKYRGSHHGTNEYPFLIDREGVAVLPVTTLRLQHTPPGGFLSSGIPGLDAMLGGQGYAAGSTVLISGGAGSGKTSIAAHAADAACRRGEACLVFLFEESGAQLARHMGSIGMDLDRWVSQGLLRIHAERPSRYGLEAHLAYMQRALEAHKPKLVIIDPVTDLITCSTQSDVHSMLTRMIDYLKTAEVTAIMTSLSEAADDADVATSGTSVSSLLDGWISLSWQRLGDERRRTVSVIKARGIAHSPRLHEFRMTGDGVQVLEGAPRPATSVMEATS